MDINVEPGRYILAVSGGVDSMVLLDILRQESGVELTVAHFNHGIRADSGKDEELVRKTAQKHGLKFEVRQGRLGSKTGEDKARRARYDFLKSVKEKHRAKSIITAHHQDDLVETVLLNILRGTGSRGLTAISRNTELTRPLLNTSKEEITDYARRRRIEWLEDKSNKDEKLLRNYIRHHITPKLTPGMRKKLLANIDKVAKTEVQTALLIATISHNIKESNQINRERFIQLPSEITDELILYWLRQYKAPDPDRKTIQRLSLAIKTARPGTSHSVRKGLWLVTGQNNAHFTTTVPKGLV